MSKEYFEGIIVFYTGDELAKITDDIVKYHNDKIVLFNKSPGCESTVDYHEKAKRFYEHLRDHYDTTATYGLRVKDLEILGITRI